MSTLFSIFDYIEKSGGLKRRADRRAIYVVKADGSIVKPKRSLFRFPNRRKIEEGDTIIVPVDFSYRQSLPFWRDVISIVYQGAVAVAAINGL